MLDRNNPQDFKAWCKRDNDVKGHRFTVVYVDKVTWPACDWFKTEADARAAMAARPAQNLQERRFNPNTRSQQCRLIWGEHTPYPKAK